MTLEELLLELKNLEYTSDVLGARSNFHVINLKHFNRVENLIRQYALDHHDEELGVLKAKVYAYEQIIANSNFAPMIIKKENTVVNGSGTAERNEKKE